MRSIYFREEHEAFRAEVRRFMVDEVAPHAAAWEAARTIPRPIFKRMGDLGFLDLLETGTDLFFAVAFLEELPRSLMGGFCAAVSVQQFMATPHILRHGSEELKRRYVLPSTQGRKVGALAITEPDTGSDVAAIRTTAVRNGDAYVVNGAKTFITNGAEGDFYTLAVRTGPAGAGGISLLVVDADAPGITRRRLEKLGWHASDTAEVVFEEVTVPVSQRIGDEHQGFAMIMESFQLERLSAAAIAIGSAQLVLELTLDYIAARQVFGQPLNRFQALRHRLADLDAELEAARQLTYHAAWLIEQGERGAREAAMAKLIATELGKRIADECLQLHGGYGFMEEYPVARMYRDARAATITAGTSEIMREIIARGLIEPAMSLPPALPLRGIVVVDVSRLLPGAVVARMLADLGARVIKVEEPGSGDPLRWAPPLVGGVGAVFCAFYRGAESVCLDLKDPAGAAALAKLCGSAHVLLESFRPGTLDRWGVGPARLLSLHPGLVICSLSGFGSHAPDAAGVAHDINLMAWSGLLSLLPGDGVPRTQIADVAAGLLATSSVMAALIGRAKSGQGGWIDQPLLSGPMPFLTLPLAESASGGGFVGDHLSGASPRYRLYTCGDGARVALGAVEDKFWAGFLQLLELPELAERGYDRDAAGQEVVERVQQKLQARPRADWLTIFEEHGLPVTAAREPHEALDDLRSAGWIEDTPMPGGGTLALPAPFLRSLSATPAQPAPRLGEHTAPVLAEFGL